MIPNFCLLVAIDRDHVDEFAISYKTWMRHKPSLRERPLLLIVDRFRSDAEWCETSKILFPLLEGHHGKIHYTAAIDRPYGSQREKMLASLTLDGPQYAQILGFQYYLKLDCDTIATGNDAWIDPAWFRGSPAIIASPWNYTKPASQLAEFQQWSDQHPGCFPRPMPKYTPSEDDSKAFHRRMISYCQFGQVDWCCQMANIVGPNDGRLPIPSQDGFLSLCAARNGAETRYVKMKNLGWQHVGGGGRRLREAAAAAMELPQT